MDKTIFDMDAENQKLRKISKTIFGESAEIQIIDPKKLKLLKQNARYFKKETFKQLIENVKNDRLLSSVPLCHRLQSGEIEVLSGNHRVQAAIEAGIDQILIIILLEALSDTRRIAIQLSHNALVGQDDRNILAALWAKIDDINGRLYAGLSSDTLNEIKNIKLINFSTPAIYTKTLTFAFTDSEKESLESILKTLGAIPSKEIHLAPLRQFDEFFEIILKAKKKFEIKNSAVALLHIIDIVKAHLGDAP